MSMYNDGRDLSWFQRYILQFKTSFANPWEDKEPKSSGIKFILPKDSQDKAAESCFRTETMVL